MHAPPRRSRRLAPWHWLRSHPRASDGLAAVLATAVNLGGTTSEWAGQSLNGPGTWPVLLAVAGTAPLALRRRFPFMVALVTGAVYYVQGFADYTTVAGGFVVLFALYSVGVYSRVWPGLFLVLAEAAGSMVYVYANPEILADTSAELSFVLLVMIFVQFPGVWIIGRAMRARRAYLKELEDRAERLEQTAEAEVRAALAEERARVARELHDVVAHHVSVMTVQATAARRTLLRDPDRAGEAMRAVEETGRSALDEMRRIVGALRTADTGTAGGGGAGPDEQGGLEPQPGTAQLEALVDRAGEAGLGVELTVIGQPRTLPPSVDLAIYRIVQEALTNTMKHAGPTEARVTIRYQPHEVDVAVVDDGADRRRRPAAAPAPVLNPVTVRVPSGTDARLERQRRGHGLIGMRERVHLNGGTLRTGPRATGGFEVSARLPLHGDDQRPVPGGSSDERPGKPPDGPHGASRRRTGGDAEGEVRPGPSSAPGETSYDSVSP